MFGLGSGKKKYDAQVANLLRDLDEHGNISPYAASSSLANDFRRTGLSEHETALGLCLTQVMSLFATERRIEAISLLCQAEERAAIWISARAVRPGLVKDFFLEVKKKTGYGTSQC